MSTLSIVIPVYNGASTIGSLVRRLVDLLSVRLDGLQIVLVNDGSPDSSDVVCRDLQVEFPGFVDYVELSRNFGEHNAVLAGLHQSRGEHVVIMDDDFQNPPEEAIRLVSHARQHGYDVVYSAYQTKQHHWFRNLGSAFNDRVANLLLDKPPGLYLSSFKCLNRFTVNEILKYSGPFPYLDGLILRCTRRIGTLAVRHDARREGRSNYTLTKLVRLWLNMSVNFSILPLRLSTAAGFLLSGFGALLGIGMVLEKFIRPDNPVGWTSLIVCILLFSGVQLVMLGIVGEYLGRLFLTSNQTPQFVVRTRLEGIERTWAPSPPPSLAPTGIPTSTPFSEIAACSSPAGWAFSAATSASGSAASVPA